MIAQKLLQASRLKVVGCEPWNQKGEIQPRQLKDHVAQRLLDLLDHAYGAAENPNGFDGLFSAADMFFFPQSAVRGLADDIDAAQDMSEGLDRHIQRIQQRIARTEVDPAG